MDYEMKTSDRSYRNVRLKSPQNLLHQCSKFLEMMDSNDEINIAWVWLQLASNRQIKEFLHAKVTDVIFGAIIKLPFEREK